MRGKVSHTQKQKKTDGGREAMIAEDFNVFQNLDRLLSAGGAKSNYNVAKRVCMLGARPAGSASMPAQSTCFSFTSQNRWEMLSSF